MLRRPALQSFSTRSRTCASVTALLKNARKWLTRVFLRFGRLLTCLARCSRTRGIRSSGGADDLPGDVGFCAAFAVGAAPPVHTGLEMLDPDGPGHGVGFLAARDAVFVEPDVLGLFAFGEE